MKAYCVSDYNGDCCCVVVFAESRSKAKTYCLYREELESCEYTELRAIRYPQLDKYCNGRKEMDWFNPEDRIALVKEAGFSCSYEYDYEDLHCEECPAKEWCERYENHNYVY